jgi:hypothetical protein
LIQLLEGVKIAGLDCKHFLFRWRILPHLWCSFRLNDGIFRVRTSSGMFLRRGQDKIIRTIEKRIADYTFIPVGM